MSKEHPENILGKEIVLVLHQNVGNKMSHWKKGIAFRKVEINYISIKFQISACLYWIWSSLVVPWGSYSSALLCLYSSYKTTLFIPINFWCNKLQKTERAHFQYLVSLKLLAYRKKKRKKKSYIWGCCLIWLNRYCLMFKKYQRTNRGCKSKKAPVLKI